MNLFVGRDLRVKCCPDNDTFKKIVFLYLLSYTVS